MGIPPHDHWDLRILQPVLDPILAGHNTLEVNIFKSASTRDTISKGVDETNAKPMEYRGPKVTGTVKERHLIRIYFSNTRTL